VKRFLRGTLVGTLAVVVLSSIAVPALAASPSAADVTTAGHLLRPGADTTVFGIDLSGSSLTTVSKVRIDFAQNGADTDFDIDDLWASPAGIQLWRDDSNSTPQTQDVLDAGDTKISDSFAFSALRATLDVTPAWHLVTADPSEGAYTLLMSIRLSNSVSDGDDFTVTLPGDAWVTNIPMLGFNAVTSRVLAADAAAPTVTSFAPPVLQTDNLYWQLSEDVAGVSNSSVSLQVQGTSTDLPVTVSYEAAAHRIKADPAQPLITGQYYDAVLLPAGPGSITDHAGNELDPDVRAFRAGRSASEGAYGATYVWRTETNSNAYSGSLTTNNMAGASASYAFTGTSVVWYTITDPTQGNAAVTIDNVSKGTINNYSSTAKFKVARTFSGLGAGAHTITIKVLGTKGSTSGTDTRVTIDAFKDGGTIKGTPSMVYRWATATTSKAYGGTWRTSRMYRTSMSFVFRGTAVTWQTILGPDQGRALVYIDGVYKGQLDNYSGVYVYKYGRTFSGLSNAQHTIQILVAGTRNPSSKQSYVVVDGFDVV
jgi:hypothetical protein